MNRLPLDGIRDIEFTHMIMGPSCGLILADLGADVIKVEPPSGDRTRKLPGWGMGFFRTYNRNKRSVVLDLDVEDGREDARRLIDTADVVVENFRPGRMAAIGFDYETLSARNPRLIYASLKGFLDGPYKHRTALDEAVQMMGGLAYMTGPPGQPLRAGASVNDVMGGMFAAIAILAAVIERASTGRGQDIETAIFETCVFLMGQHMQQFEMSGVRPDPLPARSALFGIYDVFTFRDGERLFVAITSDRHWAALCDVLDAPTLLANPRLRSNAERVLARETLLPDIAARLRRFDAADFASLCEATGIPYAPVRRPDELFGDPHLIATGGLGEVRNEAGETTRVPLLPLTMDGRRPQARRPIPAIGEHTGEVLRALDQAPDAVGAVPADGNG